MAYKVNKIVTSFCLSGFTVYKHEEMGDSSVDLVARKGNCQILPLKFSVILANTYLFTYSMEQSPS